MPQEKRACLIAVLISAILAKLTWRNGARIFSGTVMYVDSATELGSVKIRVIALSPGPLKTRATSGLDKFGELIAQEKNKSPLSSLVDINDVDAMLTSLTSPYAKNIIGDTIYIDSGYHIVD